ncbi:hypothetical protein D9757_003902 [Collybiopsis confluens]|uniref:ABC transporter domain-containing protein n=1 Tax=Collybiopsis confluens TaxID=2823264 RepID=A0A8H5HUU8_9AGAR|nr:hypothetical protein D9757_003902 [Collybiopsis confluens]
MIGRPILRKQTSYSMYRPSAIAIANTLADIRFSAAQVFISNFCVYFMSNLNRSAGAFFAFHISNYVAFLTMQRIEYTGYIEPVNSMKRWLFCIFHPNPIAYAWQGIMENEFRRINLTCDGAYIIPRNGNGVTKYPNRLGDNQVCTLFGAQSGSTFVTGRQYVLDGYRLDMEDVWRRCFIVLLGMFFFFQLTQVIALEFFPQYVANVGFRVFAKENAETNNSKKLSRPRGPLVRNDRNELRLRMEKIILVLKRTVSREYRKTFTWENLNHTVPVPGGTRRLLYDLCGYVKPGTLTALMGASSAGKTTRLDVLAQRKNIGVISGDVLVDGRPLTSDFSRGTAYAEQMDVHERPATVREAMRFSVYLRQPAEVSIEEKNAYVKEIIELLELQDLADVIVYCLGVEARKRLTIGVEFASKPELLFFLEEPTSGPDAQSASNLV